MPYFELLEISAKRPYVRTYVFEDVKEAAEFGRYLAQKSKREILLRKISDIAYLAADSHEGITFEWRSLNAVGSVYKDALH